MSSSRAAEPVTSDSENLAGLHSPIATFECNDVNPVDYLADLLIFAQTRVASRIEELLPHR